MARNNPTNPLPQKRVSPPRTLRFSDLQPEPDYFELANGEKIEFRSRVTFSALEYARLDKIRSDLEGLTKELQEDEFAEELAIALDEMAGRFVQAILPDLPDETLQGLALGAKMEIMEFWRVQNPLPGDEGEAGNFTEQG